MHVHQDGPPIGTLETFEASLDAARSALTERPRRALDAVAWLSAHLASAERVLYGRVDQVLRRALRSAAHTLQEEVRWLEQLQSGDALVSGRDGEQRRERLLQAIDGYAEVERQALTSVLAQSDVTDSDLAAAYRHALAHAPTRPHPHLPSRGIAGAVAFRLEAWWDRAMNTMDSRHVPTPRGQRPVVPAGKWTTYLTGSVSPER